MLSKLTKGAIIILAILCIMYAEYRYIMTHQSIHKGNDNIVYVEIFDQVDEYYLD